MYLKEATYIFVALLTQHKSKYLEKLPVDTCLIVDQFALEVGKLFFMKSF